MAWKKKEKEVRPEETRGVPEEKKLDPNRPKRFMYLLMTLGAVVGAFLGWKSQSLFAGIGFGFVMGMVLGIKLDTKFPPKEKKE